MIVKIYDSPMSCDLVRGYLRTERVKVEKQSGDRSPVVDKIPISQKVGGDKSLTID